MQSAFVFVLCSLQVLLACNSAPELRSTDPSLAISEGVYLFHGVPFTGTLRMEAAGVVRLTAMVNGREHGRETTVNTEGRLLEERHYSEGQKTGTHKGWYPDGRFKFHAPFEAGMPVGDHWVWHNNGRVYQWDRYGSDGTLVAAKKWRESGQIYYNLIYVDGKPVGLGGNMLCDPANQNDGDRRKR